MMLLLLPFTSLLQLSEDYAWVKRLRSTETSLPGRVSVNRVDLESLVYQMSSLMVISLVLKRTFLRVLLITPRHPTALNYVIV